MKFVDMPGSIKIDLTAGPSAIKKILKLMSVASSKAQSIVGPLSPTYFTVRWSNFHPSEIEASVAQKIINKETRKTIRINERDTVGVTRLTVAWPELLTFSPRPDLILIPTDRWQRLTERWLALLKKRCFWKNYWFDGKLLFCNSPSTTESIISISQQVEAKQHSWRYRDGNFVFRVGLRNRKQTEIMIITTTTTKGLPRLCT